MKKHPLFALLIAVVLTVPWIGIWLTHSTHAFGTLAQVGVSGLAIVGASFLLAWGAETAEKDVPQAFAIAVLAVLAVAPEYAVDALYAWEAGVDPTSGAANLAVANMTGANRILIGLGWSGIVLFTLYRATRSNDPAVEKRSGYLKSAVKLDKGITTEIAFLLAATAYAFLVPLGGTIGLVDTVILVGLYVLYIAIIVRGETTEPEEHGGVPAYLQQLPKAHRVTSVLFLFAFSGVMIYTAVHPFASGLETLGTQLGVPEFFMIQWIAPLASETPELIVVAYLVNKARSSAGFNALISSKLNQWTLLIGTLAVVFSIASGHLGGLPIAPKQTAEIWITAAQSFFAVALLVNFEISVREAVGLLVLFISQVGIEFALIQILSESAAANLSITVLYAYTVLYLLLGGLLILRRRKSFKQLLGRAAGTATDALSMRQEPGTPDRAD